MNNNNGCTDLMTANGMIQPVANTEIVTITHNGFITNCASELLACSSVFVQDIVHKLMNSERKYN